MKKKVMVELDALRNPHCGLGNFSIHLSQALYQENHDVLDIRYLARDYAQLPSVIPESCYTHLNHSFRHAHFLLPKADLWHITHQLTRYMPPRKHIPLLLTVHDLNFLYDSKPHDYKMRRLQKLQKKIDRAQYITAISEAAKKDVIEHTHPKVPVEVIYNGVVVAEPSQQKPTFIPDQPFLFSIADITAKKNFHVLLGMIKNLSDRYYILAGKNTGDYADQIREQARALGLADRIIMPGKISETDKAWCLKHCEAFCFPSTAEGFGLPVIEAMNFYRPLFLSGIPAHREVAGEFGHYFDSYDADAMTDFYLARMQQHQDDPAYRARVDAWLQRYRWSKNVKQYLRIYHDLLSC